LVVATALTALLAAHDTAARAQQSCAGDCNGDGRVAINELVLGVNIALGSQPESACPIGLCVEGPIGIPCVIFAVNNALYGCPPLPTSAGIVFNGEANRLAAYQPGPQFEKQVVVPSDRDAPGVGRDMNGQICFTRGPQGEIRFIAGRTPTRAPRTPLPAGASSTSPDRASESSGSSSSASWCPPTRWGMPPRTTAVASSATDAC
jgi:hypothetical protein